MIEKFVHIKLASSPASLVISEYGGKLDGYVVLPYTGERLAVERGGKLCTYRLSADGSEYEIASIEPAHELITEPEIL